MPQPGGAVLLISCQVILFNILAGFFFLLCRYSCQGHELFCSFLVELSQGDRAWPIYLLAPLNAGVRSPSEMDPF